MLRLKNIEEKHQTDLKEIQVCLNDECEEMRAITNLLIQTDVNPYGFLPNEWANGFDTSSGFASLLHMIYHALVDDGEISFPIVNGEPRIRFVSRWEDNYEHFMALLRLASIKYHDERYEQQIENLSGKNKKSSRVNLVYPKF